MSSSPRALALALGGVAVLAASLGLKLAAAAQPVAPPGARGETLRRFLVAHAGSVQPAETGWRVAYAGCKAVAFPAGGPGTLDVTALAYARPGDHVGYVYRGRVLARRPSAPVALDRILASAAKPFGGRSEPGYVVVIVRGCPAVPDMPWRELAG